MKARETKNREIWNRLFKMNKSIFRQKNNYIFSYNLKTDGVAVSLLFKREEYADKETARTASRESDPVRGTLVNSRAMTAKH